MRECKDDMQRVFRRMSDQSGQLGCDKRADPVVCDRWHPTFRCVDQRLHAGLEVRRLLRWHARHGRPHIQRSVLLISALLWPRVNSKLPHHHNIGPDQGQAGLFAPTAAPSVSIWRAIFAASHSNAPPPIVPSCRSGQTIWLHPPHVGRSL